MSIEINGKIYRNLQEQVEKNKEDIEELQEQESAVYTAGDGIDITEDVISIDDTVALKSELFSGDYDDLTDKPDLTVYATKSELNGYIKDNDTSYTPLFRGQGVYVKGDAGASYTTTMYNDGSISRSIPRTPGYTLIIPTKDGTLATTGDIPSLTNYVTLDGTQTITGSKTFGAPIKVEYNNSILFLDHTGVGCQIGPLGNAAKSLWMQVENGIGDAIFTWYNQSTGTGTTYKLPHTDSGSTTNYTLATTADIPTLSGLTMYNYKITISGVDSGTSTARSAVYIVSLPYQWDYSSLTKYDIIHLVPVWSVVVDTATTNSKIMGRFHWQTGTIAQIDWVDGTHTFMDFTGGFNATVEAAAPAHW